MKLDENMLAKMREATHLLQTSGPAAATAAIQRALQGLATPDVVTPNPAWAAPMSRSGVLHDINSVPDGRADPVSESASDLLARFRHASRKSRAGTSAKQPVHDIEEVDVAGKGKFLAGSYSNHAGARAYKLYVPSGYSPDSGQALPLIVMLHGCQQHPDDFAAGTGMNLVAEENNCFVVYPAQAQAANGSNCWNWFKEGDQQRDRGEPSILAGITREIMHTYRVDTRRVYVAGLSAGGAMAAIMGTTYPELYAAVGIHSGLPYGAAHDLPSAFAAMKNGVAAADPGNGRPNGTAARHPTIPIIVFHGDRDATVHPRNGDQVLAQCVPDADCDMADIAQRLGVTMEKGAVPHGRAYTRIIRRDGNGKAIAEQWIVHGAGHAWSGGSRSGSYTDPKGPNASQEMVRFFYSQKRECNGS